MCGYELPTDLQNLTQKDLTEVKIFQKVYFLGELLFFWNTVYVLSLRFSVHPSVRPFVTKLVNTIFWK